MNALLALVAVMAQDADLTQFVSQAEATAPAPAVDEIRPLALDALQAQAGQRQEACTPDGLALEAPQSATATPDVVQGIRTRQLKNAWTVYGQPVGCPGSPRVRFLALRRPDNSLRVLILNAGESLANVSVLRQTFGPAGMIAFNIVRESYPSCAGNDLTLFRTRIVARTPDLSADWHGTYFAGSWQEAWTFSLCGRRVELPITFTADGQGGIRPDVRTAEARIVEP